MNNRRDTAILQSGAGLYLIDCRDAARVNVTELDASIKLDGANQVILLNASQFLAVGQDEESIKLFRKNLLVKQIKFDEQIYGMELISQNRIVIAFYESLKVFEIKNNKIE